MTGISTGNLSGSLFIENVLTLLYISVVFEENRRIVRKLKTLLNGTPAGSRIHYGSHDGAGFRMPDSGLEP